MSSISSGDFINLNDDSEVSTVVSLEDTDDDDTEADKENRYMPYISNLFSTTIQQLFANMGGLPQFPLLDVRCPNTVLAMIPANDKPHPLRIYAAFSMRARHGYFGPSKCVPHEVYLLMVNSDSSHVRFTFRGADTYSVESCSEDLGNCTAVLLVSGVNESIFFYEKHLEMREQYYLAGWTSWTLKRMCVCSADPVKMGFELLTHYEYIACMLNEFLPKKHKISRKDARTVEQLYNAIQDINVPIQLSKL